MRAPIRRAPFQPIALQPRDEFRALRFLFEGWPAKGERERAPSPDAVEKVLQPSRLYLAHFREVVAVGV